MRKNFEDKNDDLELNFSDESLADYLEFLIRIIPTSMPEWMD